MSNTATTPKTVNVKLANDFSFPLPVEDIPEEFWADAALIYDIEVDRDRILEAVRSDFVKAWRSISAELGPRAIVHGVHHWHTSTAPAIHAAMWTEGGKVGAVARIRERLEEGDMIRVKTTAEEGWGDWREFTTDHSVAIPGAISAVRPGLNQAAHFNPASILAVEAQGRGVVYER